MFTHYYNGGPYMMGGPDVWDACHHDTEESILDCERLDSRDKRWLDILTAVADQQAMTDDWWKPVVLKLLQTH